MPRTVPFHRFSETLLLAVQFDDQLFVDVLIDIFTARLSEYAANEILRIDNLEPARRPRPPEVWNAP